jgi:AcrR family transcriptional regulator
MPRRTPSDRVCDVARAACRVFTGKGYQQALMTDVGTELGLSHALLYRYVEGKEALFELALRYAMDPDAISAIQTPLPVPPQGLILGLVKGWAGKQASFPVLSAALTGDHAGELGGIIDEFYAFIEHNRRLLALIERSALDLPELHAFYYTELRRAYVGQLTAYLRRGASSADLRPVSDVSVAARFIVESIAWFAWHRTADPDSDMITDEQARQTVRELLLAAFVPSERGLM